MKVILKQVQAEMNVEEICLKTVTDNIYRPNGDSLETTLQTIMRRLSLDELNFTASVGDIVQYSGYDWLVVHIERTATYSHAYLILNEIHSLSAFSDSGTTYGNSLLHQKCMELADTFDEEFSNRLLDVICKGVTGKVWVPTGSQVGFTFTTAYDTTDFDKKTFDYFNHGNNQTTYRVATFEGVNTAWYTSTAVGTTRIWRVTQDGARTNSGALYEDILGFRPCVCLDITHQNQLIFLLTILSFTYV